MTPVLLISHGRKVRCGIYQFGAQVAKALEDATRHRFHYAECLNEADYHTVVKRTRPDVIIYNHSPTTMPWLRRGIMHRAHAIQVGIIHEVTQGVADAADDRLFEYHIAADPTLELRNPIVFKTGRLVPAFRNDRPLPAVPTIGSFGFGTNGKGFETLIARVQDEFDEAIIRLHIPFSDFFDGDGRIARVIVDRCRGLIVKPGVRIEFSHEFLSSDQLLAFLAGNSMNAFLYENQPGRGISSVIDLALAVGRPIAISRSMMFRHLHDMVPPATVEDTTLRAILSRGFEPFARYASAWTAAALVEDYEGIVDAVMTKRHAIRAHSPIMRLAQDVLWEAESLRHEVEHRATSTAQVIRETLVRHPTLRRAVRALRGWATRRPAAPGR